MRPSSIVMLAVALVLGISAALLSKVWLQAQFPKQQEASKTSAVEMGTVVIAASPGRLVERLIQLMLSRHVIGLAVLAA
jgi:Flp pilus assembly protein CpaB